jgi:VanZ family protein
LQPNTQQRGHGLKPINRIVVAWIPTASYMALIWFLSSVSLRFPVVSELPFKDKGIHFVEYGVLGVLTSFALTRTFPAITRIFTASLAIFLTVMWGVLDEIHQAFVPGRTSQVDDVIADSLGALCGTALFVLVVVWRDRNKKVSVHAPNKAAVNSPVKSSAPTGPARSVLPVHDEPARGRKPLLRDELAAVETKGQHPGEHLHKK